MCFAGMSAKCLLALELFWAELALVLDGASLLLNRLTFFLSGLHNFFTFHYR